MSPAESSDSRHRILVLIKGLGIGGAERLVSEGSRFWSQDRFEYRVAYILPWKDQLVPDLAANGFHAVCIGGSAWLLNAPHRLRRLVLAFQPHLIHAHLPVAGIIARVTTTTPLVYTEHSLAGAQRPATRVLNRLTYWRNREVIAVSQAVARSLEGYPGPSPRVIPNGVHIGNVTAARTRVRKELAIDGDRPLIVHVGNIRPQKGHATLIEAAEALQRSIPEVVIVSIGAEKHPGDLDRARDQAERAGGVVRYLGRRTDAIDFIAGADVLVNPSDVEGLPLVVLEAMMAGTPVVATAVGGVPSVIRNGETGHLVPVGEPHALAAALAEAVVDTGNSKRMAGKAQEIAQRRFSLEAMVEAHEALYSEVLDG